MQVSQLDKSRLLYLLSGTDRGYNAWYFVLFESRLKFTLFSSRLKQKSEVELEDYCTIIKSGWGENPPEFIIQKIKEELHDFTNRNICT